MDIQQAITLFIVAVAAAYMARHLWKSAMAKDNDSCGGCGGCGKPPAHVEGVRTAPTATPLVTLSNAPQRRFKPRA